MHLTAKEEYGLRCLVQVARRAEQGSVPTHEIAEAEGLSREYTAKLLRSLREGGLLRSTRGAQGGYELARRPEAISVWETLDVLGGPFFPEGFCESHAGMLRDCTHTPDCSIRALWRWLDHALRSALGSMTLSHLAGTEASIHRFLGERVGTASTGPWSGLGNGLGPAAEETADAKPESGRTGE